MTFCTYPESTPKADRQPACGTLLNRIFPTRNLPTCRAGLQGLLDGRMTAILLPTAEAVRQGKEDGFCLCYCKPTRYRTGEGTKARLRGRAALSRLLRAKRVWEDLHCNNGHRFSVDRSACESAPLGGSAPPGENASLSGNAHKDALKDSLRDTLSDAFGQ